MWAYVALGGLVGTLARYQLQAVLQPRSANAFPVGTLVVNLLGSLLLGFIGRWALETAAFAPETRAGLTIGLCGGFTTMSSFAYESLALMGDGQYGRAAVYFVTTTLGSVVAVAVGAAAAQKLA
jgi:CrcB protein